MRKSTKVIHISVPPKKKKRNIKITKGKMAIRTIEELQSGACLYWPKDLAMKAAAISSLSPLIETQDLFLSVLKTASKTPQSWELVTQQSADLSPNLFLKHLMVLSDIGGERLQRFSKDFDTLFPSKKFKFIWNGVEHVYKFTSTAESKWTNKKLNVEKSVLLTPVAKFTPCMIDVCMLLMWGSSIIENNKLPTELVEKCMIGTLLGRSEELDTFVKQRYLAVSKITGGSTANDLGHICEEYIVGQINQYLPPHINLGGHTIKDITHNDKNLTTFDLVATNVKTSKCVGIEISFQVTTNSVIERKAGLAKSRQDLVHKKGHFIAYVIDGSGNFHRRSAIQSLLNFSDCTVNFSAKELKKLSEFILEATK